MDQLYKWSSKQNGKRKHLSHFPPVSSVVTAEDQIQWGFKDKRDNFSFPPQKNHTSMLWPSLELTCILILLHLEWPKLYGVLAVLSAIGLMETEQKLFCTHPWNPPLSCPPLSLSKLIKTKYSHPADNNIPFYRCLRFFYLGLLSPPRLKLPVSQNANHCSIIQT